MIHGVKRTAVAARAAILPAVVLGGLMALSQSASAQLSYTTQWYQLSAGIQGEYADPSAAPDVVMLPVDVSKTVEGGDPVSTSVSVSVRADRHTPLRQIMPSTELSTTLNADGFHVILSSRDISSLPPEDPLAHASSSTSGMFGIVFDVTQAGDYTFTGTTFGDDWLGVGAPGYGSSVVLFDSNGWIVPLDGANQSASSVLSLAVGTYTLSGFTGATYQHEAGDEFGNDVRASFEVSLQAVQAVPEPATYALMGLGLLAVAARVRSRARAL